MVDIMPCVAVGLDDPAVLRVATGPGLLLGTRFTDSDPETVLAAINRFRLAAAQRGRIVA
jgi:hypothetical protein